MNEIDHFKVFILYSGDVTADVDHLHIKRIHLVGFSYIVIEDTFKIIFTGKHSTYFVEVIFTREQVKDLGAYIDYFKTVLEESKNAKLHQRS
jgi:hypothetical protein